MKCFKFLIISIILQNCYNYAVAQVLDEATFKQILNNQFVNIITGQNKNTIGNFGGVDIKDASVSLNASKISKKGNIFSLNANAAVNDGFSSIFTNSKLNSDVGLQLRYSIIRPYSRAITYIQSSIQKRDYEIKRMTNAAAAEKAELQSKKVLIEKQVDLLKKQVADLTTQLRSVPEDKDLIYQHAYKTYQLDSLTTIYERDLSNLTEAQKSIDTKLKSFTKKAKLEIPEITGFKFGWINLVYKVTSQSFRLFDPVAAFSDQVKKDNYVSHKAGVEYNYYKWSSHPGESWFFSVGATIDLGNNLSGLSKTELSEVTNHGVTSGQRTSIKKYNVFTGNYQKDLVGGNFYSDYYKFIFDNNNAAIHLYPQVKLQKSEKPVYSFGLGFMVAFKDQKDEKNKSILNAELYANFIDLTNTGNSDKKLLERNDIGIRFSFPIKFVY